MAKTTGPGPRPVPKVGVAYFLLLPAILVALAALALIFAAAPYVLGWFILFYGWMFR